MGAQIAQLADRRRAFGQDIAAPNSLVYTEISPIVSPSNSPSRQRQGAKVGHDPVVEDLQEKYQSLLRRFEQTVQMSSDALNLSRLSQGLFIEKHHSTGHHQFDFYHLDTPSTTASDLHLLLNDLRGEKKSSSKQDDIVHADYGKNHADIEDDLALILNERQPRQVPKTMDSNDNDDQPTAK